MMENDVPSAVASAHGGHKNLKSKESYISKTEVAKKAVNKIMSDSLRGEETGKYQDIVEKESMSEKNRLSGILGKQPKIDEDKENETPNKKQ